MRVPADRDETEEINAVTGHRNIMEKLMTGILGTCDGCHALTCLPNTGPRIISHRPGCILRCFFRTFYAAAVSSGKSSTRAVISRDDMALYLS